MKKPDVTPRAAAAAGAFADPKWQERYPLVWEHLAHTEWEDGGARETSTVVIRIEDGRFNMALNDREQKASAYVTADTIADGMAALEKGLKAGTTDWRPWKGGKKRK